MCCLLINLLIKTMQEDDGCPICCEDFNSSGRLEVRCVGCPYRGCRTCYKRYLLDEKDPRCMSCGQQWDAEFLLQAMGRGFCNGALKRHREETLYDREQALLPSTQSAAVVYVRKKALSQERDEIDRSIRTLKKRKLEVCRLLREKEEKKEERRQFIKGCPRGDCPGYLTTGYTCPLCSTKVCPKCQVVKGADHVCAPEDLETVQLLRRTTKPCPGCGTPVHHLGGCAQMWSPCCKIFWDWRTLRLIRHDEPRHNPEYFRYLRENGRGRERGNCGVNLHRLVATRAPEYATVLQFAAHLQFVLPAPVELLQRHRQLRIQFLAGEITRGVFRERLQRAEKSSLKAEQKKHVADTFLALVTDIVEGDLTDADQRLDGVREFFNDGMRRVSKTFSCLVQLIEPGRWQLLKSAKYG